MKKEEIIEKTDAIQTMTIAGPSRREVSRTFRLDIVAASLYSAFSVATISFPAVLVRQEGAADWIVSLVIAAPSIGQFATLFWSRFTQSSPKMKVMAWGGGLARLSLLLMVFAFHPFIFAMIMVLCNILEFSKSPAYASIMQQVYPANRRGELMGKVRVIASVATVIASAVIGAALETHSYRLVFPIAGLFGVASMVVFSRIHYHDQPTTRKPTPLRQLIMIPRTDKRYGTFLWAVFLMGFFNLLGYAIFPIIIVDDLHVSNSFVGIINGLQSFAALIFYFVCGSYTDRHHPIKLVYLTFLVGAGAIFIYMMAGTGWLLLLAAILVGVGAAAGDLGAINSAIRFPQEAQDIPHYMALYSTLVGVRGVITPFLAALLLGLVGSRGVLLIAFIGVSLSCLNFYRVQKALLADPYFADPLATVEAAKRGKRRLLPSLTRRS